MGSSPGSAECAEFVPRVQGRDGRIRRARTRPESLGAIRSAGA